MQTMPSIDYMGYAVAVNVLAAPCNRYYSAFIIRRHASRGLGVQSPIAYQEDISSGVICETAELARQTAGKRARSWIDAHPAH